MKHEENDMLSPGPDMALVASDYISNLYKVTQVYTGLQDYIGLHRNYVENLCMDTFYIFLLFFFIRVLIINGK